MHRDQAEKYRPLLEDDPPPFLDRVNTPWDHVPDLAEYNQDAYRKIVRALKALARTKGGGDDSNSQGILVLGEAGTGKTHLLMRVARNLSDTNHVLFVRKPNNEDAVAQHVWANMVSSLTRSLPASGSKRSQLDDLLAHVFTAVLIPGFELDIQEGKDDLKRRWVEDLKADPYNLFKMLGEGEQRQSNMDKIRRRTLRHLMHKHPDVDQRIAHVLITYCFVAREDRKRVLLTWLSGQDVDQAEAKDLGLDTSWVKIDETSADVGTQQQREEQALRAIRTIGILSTYYQPLILAFDQLEGLRDQERLSHRWGDTVREIFTMTPNLLVVTCIFPSLWESWFNRALDRSVTERAAQQTVNLETFGPQHGLKMLAAHMEPSFAKHRLPTSIYPFTEDDVTALCSKATSPRSFIQNARTMFEAWLDDDDAVPDPVKPKDPVVVTQKAVDSLIRSTMDEFEKEHSESYESEIPVEQDFFGRVKNIVEALLKHSGEKVAYGKATCGQKVMPPNLVVKPAGGGDSLCLGVINSEATSFAAKMRNVNDALRSGDGPKKAIVLRDRRCKAIGDKGREYVEAFEAMGNVYLHAGADEISSLNAIYDTLVAVEEHDLSIGTHEVDLKQFVEFLKGEGVARKRLLLRSAANLAGSFARAVGTPVEAASPAGASGAVGVNPKGPPAPMPSAKPASRKITTTTSPKPISTPTNVDGPSPRTAKPGVEISTVPVDVVVGDTELDGPSLGLLGRLKDDRRTVAVSFAKPQCMVLLGYMGSGKSYGLGVLIESALLSIPHLSRHRKPMCVVAFNYRKNAEARFEYWGFKQPNTKPGEVSRLRSEYQAVPVGIGRVNVFGYGPELQRRASEYRGIQTYPIQFRASELGAEHWEILMKPPSPQAEYMDVIRDIIQKLFYQERLTYKNLEKHILTDERLSNMQRQKATNRLSFARKWVSDDRAYEWDEVLTSGSLNVFDLRMQALSSDDALKLCLVMTDLVRRTRNGVNKMVVFDEAHEYVDSKDLVAELENAITQIRHDGLSFVLASQYPDRIPDRIFKYLLTRLIFKTPDQKAINAIRKAAPNLAGLSPQQVSNLGLEQGSCFIQSDDDCTDSLLKVPQLMAIRPRCSMHGGETVRNS
jgi:hypothetical protein